MERPGPAEANAAVLRGEVAAVARLIRDLDDERPGARERLRELFPHTGRAHVVGVTGAPGAGKSSIIDRLITAYRQRGDKVGVVAVDPSSPFGGGAILGDRIRMQRHAGDPGVFIRSLATRGHLGGLTRSTGDVIDVLDASGKDVILVETVGVGQDEIEVMQLAHTTVVVQVPGLGDDVQAIKAGLLEVADVFAVNKCDLHGADAVVQDLAAMLATRRSGRRNTQIVKVQANEGHGIVELLAALDRHRAQSGPDRDAGDRRRLLRRFESRLREALFERGKAKFDALPASGELMASLQARTVDPDAAAQMAADAILGRGGC